MRLGYYCKNQGQSLEDTIYFKDITEHDYDQVYYDDFAESASEHAWDHNDGWEWLRDGSVLTLVIDEKEIGDFKITVETEPVFYASKIKEEV